MKKWIIFISVFTVSLCLFLSVFVLWKAGQPFSAEQAKAEQLALQEDKLAEVNDSEVYSGSNIYITVIGKDQSGEEKAVFIPDNLDDLNIEEVLLKKGISKIQAIETVEKEFKVKKVLHTKLGWEENNAVWEITFLSQNNKLNYVYLFFENGTWWKRILNL
ncbi:DUF5590 domain-containing protein [Paenisporosarcina sp. TG20]|uniref:cell wall elongation regulator TseB-like domain-containing protein n=1 Tax=Paenisporosarcina sp. TG20 TaxID=1211706 RepID=UPI0002FD8688|nr:DUF5590 domain-containing protein [Paenisporosarcina sp. TG20]